MTKRKTITMKIIYEISLKLFFVFKHLLQKLKFKKNIIFIKIKGERAKDGRVRYGLGVGEKVALMTLK